MFTFLLRYANYPQGHYFSRNNISEILACENFDQAKGTVCETHRNSAHTVNCALQVVKYCKAISYQFGYTCPVNLNKEEQILKDDNPHFRKDNVRGLKIGETVRFYSSTGQLEYGLVTNVDPSFVWIEPEENKGILLKRNNEEVMSGTDQEVMSGTR